MSHTPFHKVTALNGQTNTTLSDFFSHAQLLLSEIMEAEQKNILLMFNPVLWIDPVIMSDLIPV